MIEKNNVSRIAYSKIFSPLIIPNTISKIVYLDTDILIVRPLTPLFDFNFDNSLAACQGASDEQLSGEKLSFNSGVMVLNLDKMRNSWDWEFIIKSFQDNTFSRWMDTTILRRLYGSDWYEIPTSFNFIINGKSQKYFQSSDLSVIHFAGRPKPWDTTSDSIFDYLWRFVDYAVNSLQKKNDLILDWTTDSFLYQQLNSLYHAILSGRPIISPHRIGSVLEATRTELEATRTELEAIIGSTIWRVFKPYRSILKIIQR